MDEELLKILTKNVIRLETQLEILEKDLLALLEGYKDSNGAAGHELDTLIKKHFDV